MGVAEEQRLGPVIGVRGDNIDAHVLPVMFSREICATPEQVRHNVMDRFARPYDAFTGLLASPHGGTISIVGSAPSLRDHYQDITGDVLACNAAHDFLIERGIVPKFGMMFDAHPVCADFMTPHPDVTYLFASRCHPDVFAKFRDYKVVVWHALGDPAISSILEETERMEPMINGGGAAVLRSMGLAVAMGYTVHHLFGADSSMTNGDTHVKPSLVEEKELDIFCSHRWFKTTAWMAAQAEDFKILAMAFRDAGCRIVIHGSGLLPHIAAVLGFEVHGETA